MMESMQLCVDVAGTAEEVADTIGSVLGVQFALQSRRYGEVLRAQVGDAELIIIDGQFEGENETSFEGFRYYIRIDASTDEAMRQYASKAFEMLKRTNRFKLLLVEDLIDMVEEYTPTKDA